VILRLKIQSLLSRGHGSVRFVHVGDFSKHEDDDDHHRFKPQDKYKHRQHVASCDVHCHGYPVEEVFRHHNSSDDESNDRQDNVSLPGEGKENLPHVDHLPEAFRIEDRCEFLPSNLQERPGFERVVSLACGCDLCCQRAESAVSTACQTASRGYGIVV
jgi:hypothetical protein